MGFCLPCDVCSFAIVVAADNAKPVGAFELPVAAVTVEVLPFGTWCWGCRESSKEKKRKTKQKKYDQKSFFFFFSFSLSNLATIFANLAYLPIVVDVLLLELLTNTVLLRRRKININKCCCH